MVMKKMLIMKKKKTRMGLNLKKIMIMQIKISLVGLMF